MLRFGIDYDMDEQELDRRQAFEQRMFRRGDIAAKIVCMDALDRSMKKKQFFPLWVHEDATVEYAIHDSIDETRIFIQRDWAKAGFLRAAYKVYVYKPGGRKYYYRVRSVRQFERAINRTESAARVLVADSSAARD
jgi:hypothetical protein